MKIFFTFATLLALLGCTDAGCSKLTRFGDSAHIECWSGDTIIFKSESTGAVQDSEQSDGYYFRDKADNKLTEVSGNCILKY